MHAGTEVCSSTSNRYKAQQGQKPIRKVLCKQVGKLWRRVPPHDVVKACQVMHTMSGRTCQVKYMPDGLHAKCSTCQEK